MHDVVVFFPGLPHAGPGHALKQTLNLLRTVSEVVSPEVVAWILDQLDECDQQAPGVWSVHNQTLQQYPGDLLLNNLLQHGQGNKFTMQTSMKQKASKT